MSNTFDFEAFKAQAIEQLKAGVPLSGKDGVLAFRLTEPAKEVIKDWRRPAAVLLRLAIPFGLSALNEEESLQTAFV